MLTLLLGTDWTENRSYILNRIAQHVSNRESGHILMVPELISHDTERRLADFAGDIASRYSEVLSFTRLARRVADACGHSAIECLDNGGRVVAMANAVQQVRSRLKAYASVGTRPEFLTGLVDAVDEFKRCCISAADIMSASKMTVGSLAQKLEELSIIMEAYDGVCLQGKRDPRDQMTWLLEELETGDYAQSHVFWIDGFPDFTRQHLAILEHLICNSRSVTVSLNCDEPNSNKPAFEKAGETAAELIRIAQRRGAAYRIEMVNPRNDQLSSVRNGLFSGSCLPVRDNSLSLFRTDTVYHECMVVAERILEKIQCGARYRDIGIVCADMNIYRNTLAMVLKRCGIPVYLSGTEDILEKSVISTVVTAIETALGGFEQKDVLRYLRTALSPLSTDTCDRLENYVILWGITGRQWLREWTQHPDGLDGNWTDRAKEKLSLLNQSRRSALEPLEKLSKSIHDAPNVHQQVQGLYEFLQQIKLSKMMERNAAEFDRNGDNRNAQILNQLWEILLTALEQLDAVLGESTWDSDSFTRLFRLLLSQYDVGTIPATLDSVIAGPVSAMRCQEVKHLFVLGALEGALPGFAGVTGVLTDQDRIALRDLGVPLTGGSFDGLQAEFAEIYGVFCGAHNTITVSCPDGQPSYLYHRLERMTNEAESIMNCLGSALTDPVEAAAFLARTNSREEAEMLGLTAEFNTIFDSVNHELGDISKDNIRHLYGEKLNLSASQADRQADCRLSYFMKYGLRAKERKPASIDPAEFGTYVHAVLENTAAEVMEQGGFHEISMDDVLKIARKHADAYANERFAQIDSERVRYLFRRNAQELEMIVAELWKELHDSEFMPAYFELSFGENGLLPPIEIPNCEIPAQLCGFIDRVDVWDQDGKKYIRVVDYKTGKKNFDYCDIFNGLGLQMLLYLFALEKSGEKVFGQKPTPAGVQYFPARVPMLNVDEQSDSAAIEAARDKIWKRKGLLLSDQAVLDAMDSDTAPGRLPYTVKRDGSMSGDIADAKQFTLLDHYVFDVLKRMVDDIATGHITPNPYTRGNNHNACSFCPYGAVCHASSVEDRRDYKTMSQELFWEKVEKEVDRIG